MRNVILATVLVALSTVATYASADSTEEYCQNVAKLTTTYAQARDNGLSEREVRIEANDAISEEDASQYVATDVRYIAASVFEFPHDTPTKEGNDMYRLCIDVYTME